MTAGHPDSWRGELSYRELFELGSGGMGTVSLARAVGAGGFERLVVVKRMHAHLLSHAEASRRFLHEAHAASKLHHANVVGIQQVGYDERGYFLVLDFVEGGSLESLVDRSALKGELLGPPLVLRVVLDALAGLQAAHEARDSDGGSLGILHRDVSLQNILVGTDGVARVADFGIAKSAISSVSTDHASMVGKLLYVPPEHLRREPAGPVFDVYSLGVTMWLALTGAELWGEADESQIVRHILDDGVPPLSSAGVLVAPQLETVVARACAKVPSDRYATAREMREAIERVSRETGWLASHSEVAEVVSRLMGADLERLRSRVGDLSRAGYSCPDAGEAEGTRSAGGSRVVSAQAGPRARWRTWGPIGGVVVLIALIAGGGAWWLATRPETTIAPVQPVESMGSAGSEQAQPTSEHEAPPSSSAEVAETQPPGVFLDAEPRPTGPRPTTLPRSTVPSSPVTASDTSPRPADTDVIVKKNPYR